MQNTVPFRFNMSGLLEYASIDTLRGAVASLTDKVPSLRAMLHGNPGRRVVTIGAGATAAIAALAWAYYQWNTISMVITTRGTVEVQPGKVSSFLTDVAADMERNTKMLTAARAILRKTKPDVAAAARDGVAEQVLELLHEAEQKALKVHQVKLEQVKDAWEAIEAAHAAKVVRHASGEEDDPSGEEEEGEEGEEDDASLPHGVTSAQAQKVVAAGFRLRRVLAPFLMDKKMLEAAMDTIDMAAAVETGKQVRRSVDELEGMAADLPKMSGFEVVQAMGTRLDRMQKAVKKTCSETALLQQWGMALNGLVREAKRIDEAEGFDPAAAKGGAGDAGPQLPPGLPPQMLAALGGGGGGGPKGGPLETEVKGRVNSAVESAAQQMEAELMAALQMLGVDVEAAMKEAQ